MVAILSAVICLRFAGQGRQTEDRGCRNVLSKRMETVDDEIRDAALKFIEKAEPGNKPFFLAQSDPHAHRHPPVGKIQKIAKLQERLAIHEAGMA